MRVVSGDLIHADQHGAVVIPWDVADKVLAAAQGIVADVAVDEQRGAEHVGGDPIEPLETGRTPFSVRQIWDMCHNGAGTLQEAEAALQLKTLGREWRKSLENRLRGAS